MRRLLTRAMAGGGLLAAVALALSVIRGEWAAALFAGTMVISAATLLGLWGKRRHATTLLCGTDP